MESCPHCNQELDPQFHLARASLLDLPATLLSWERPRDKRARKFTVRCPHCARTYVSRTVRRWGFVTHGNYVYVVALLCFAAVVIVLLSQPRG